MKEPIYYVISTIISYVSGINQEKWSEQYRESVLDSLEVLFYNRDYFLSLAESTIEPNNETSEVKTPGAIFPLPSKTSAELVVDLGISTNRLDVSFQIGKHPFNPENKHEIEQCTNRLNALIADN